jgi:hypothetical protein
MRKFFFSSKLMLFVFLLIASCSEFSENEFLQNKRGKYAVRLGVNDQMISEFATNFIGKALEPFSNGRFSTGSEFNGYVDYAHALHVPINEKTSMLTVRIKDHSKPFDIITGVGIFEEGRVKKTFAFRFEPDMDQLAKLSISSFSERDILKSFNGSVLVHDKFQGFFERGRVTNASLPPETIILDEIVVYGTPINDPVNPYLYWQTGIALNYNTLLLSVIPSLEINWASGTGYVPLPSEEDPIDVTYFLTGMNGTDVNNPIDGAKAVDSRGTVYTFNLELGAWLLPEIAVLASKGFQVRFTHTPPSFNSTVVTGVWVGGLAEPTPVGEIFAVATTLVVGSIYAYNVIAYYLAISSVTEDDRESCLLLYEKLCTSKYAHKNLPCGQCLQFCYVQGYWDFLNCPLKE